MKKLPEFKNEDDERKFWATADSTEYVDWQSGKRKKTRRSRFDALSRDGTGSSRLA
jgi:hypothetical protein